MKVINLCFSAAVVLFALLSEKALGAPNCTGVSNTLPIYDGDGTLVKSVENGVLYKTGGPNLDPQLLVAHVYGTHYEMGYAHGELLKDEINTVLPEMLKFIYKEIDGYIKFLPEWLRNLIEKYGVEAALEITYYLTRPFIPTYFIEEIQGLANATGLDFDYVMRINLFPELIQAGCSILGAWGDASIGNSLYQLRALDWGTNSPLQQYPLFLVYHPSKTTYPAAHNFGILSWAGNIGAITGYSENSMAICEKVWLHYNGTQNRAGYPWMFMLRDILEYDNSVDEALNRIYGATRTCSMFLGIGHGDTNDFNILEYSYQRVVVFDDSNFTSPHVNFKDIIYVDKHTQPSSNPCLPNLLKEYYGKIDGTTIVRYITSQFQTGDMHIAVFDHAKRLVYISNAGVSVDGKDGEPAYNRHFTQLDMKKLFSHPHPNGSFA